MAKLVDERPWFGSLSRLSSIINRHQLDVLMNEEMRHLFRPSFTPFRTMAWVRSHIVGSLLRDWDAAHAGLRCFITRVVIRSS